MKNLIFWIIFIFSVAVLNCNASEDKSGLSVFPDDEIMQKIMKRCELEHQGHALAEQGRYQEALQKYRLAMDPSLINYDGDGSVSLCCIRNIYKYQGKYQDALELNEKEILPLNPNKDEYVEASMELRALIKSSDTKDFKPIYDYITYLKEKDFKRQFGPDAHVATLIFLYNYMRDYESGVTYMDELIKYHTQHPDANHRSAHAKDVREYQRVKEAWELDKKTGKHGHLQGVIRTSDIIGW